MMEKDTGKKTRISLRAFYVIIIVVEIIIIIAGASGILELIHESFEVTKKVPNMVWLVIIGLVLSVITNIFITRFLSLPITTLKEAMKDVADGHFEVNLDTDKGFTEIREISESFDAMTKELRATEIVQTDFISNVSHEFKTPINAIEGYATLLQDSELSDSEAAECLDKILYNTKRLSTLVGNILLLSKVDNQGIPNKKSIYRLDEQIRQAIVALEPKWLERECEFDVELASIEYEGCEPLLYHVFDNLIGNAIKFGPVGGVVRVRLFRAVGEIVFTVEDEGPGIDREHMKHIFNKFYQIDSSHKVDGNGLGLALVQRILELTGGKVFVENLPTQGAKFTVVMG